MNETESIPCPFCGEMSEVPIDPSAGSQLFTTDCEVCCRPFDVEVRIGLGGEPEVKVCG